MKTLREKINRRKEFLKYSLNAPKVFRTHVYASTATTFEMRCPRGKTHKIEHSEFEGHILCYKCEKDYFLPWGSYFAGIFSGPIPIQAAKLMGFDFRRINIKTQEIVDAFLGTTEEPANSIYNATWVKTPKLIEYDQKGYERFVR